MSDIYILNLFADLRSQILNTVTSSKRQINYIPKGFNNNLHWQLGHVLTITNELIFGLSGVGSQIPSDYGVYFASGTSPSNWSGRPPEVEVIMKKLEEQKLKIIEMYDGKMAEPVVDQNNFLQASVIGDLFHVLIAHESMHLGMIIAMVKVLQNE